MLAPDCTTSRIAAALLAMTPADIERFWSKVDKTPGHGPNGDCWVWTASKSGGGYGHVHIQGVHIDAHRVAYFLENGTLPPPDRPLTLHSCDNRPCCRGDHLWAGTQADNMNDMRRKGREASGDKHGTRTHPHSWPRGERHASATVSDADVIEAVAIYKAGGKSLVAVGAMFGVCAQTVNNWVHGKMRAAGR